MCACSYSSPETQSFNSLLADELFFIFKNAFEFMPQDVYAFQDIFFFKKTGEGKTLLVCQLYIYVSVTVFQSQGNGGLRITSAYSHLL